MTECIDNSAGRPSSHSSCPSIPLTCAEQFCRIEHRLTGIETKLDSLISSQTTWIGRMWGVAKALALLIAGWFLGNHK